MVLAVIAVLILFFFWPVILAGIIIFLIWMFWPEKKWQCLGCYKKFHRENNCKEHSKNCEENRRREERNRQQEENRRREEEQRSRRKYRHRWGKNRDSSIYDNPFDDEFWDDDFSEDDKKYWDEQEEFWKDVDPEWFYNRRGDYYHSHKNFKKEQEYWKKRYSEHKRQYEEAKKEYDRAYEELFGKLNKIDVKKCYKKLGLATNATFDEVKKQFRILALKYHPDKCKNKKIGEEKFKEIFEAYETIKNSVTDKA
tara:strand:- start:1249 stop:2010 length:762 start_codon:yes stop_codon:yes gene_type:complete